MLSDLSDSEAREAFNALVVALRDNGLSWVADQVEATIALGKPRRRQLPISPTPLAERGYSAYAESFEEARQEKRRKALFTVAEEYNARERLQILIEATDACVIQVSEFAKDVLDATRHTGVITDVQFHPEVEGRSGYAISADDLEQRIADVGRLRMLLNELLEGPSMPMRPGLLAEIQSALGNAVIPNLTATSAGSDLFEAYIFGLILDAARREGATVTLACRSGGIPNPFVFRTSPGHLSSTTQDYGHAAIAFPDCPALEAHVGIRVAGHSGVLHECDVSVIQRDEAELCRESSIRVAPRSARVLLALEAKFYSVELPLHLGRAFLGLVRDLSCDAVFFVMNRGAPSIEKLLAHKKQQWEKHVNPGQAHTVERLRNAIQTRFRDFQARYAS